jgi:hypothetical protein
LCGSADFVREAWQWKYRILRFTFNAKSIDADAFARRCLAEGVRIRSIGGNFIRATTHLDVSTQEAQAAAQVMLHVARGMAERADEPAIHATSYLRENQ